MKNNPTKDIKLKTKNLHILGAKQVSLLQPSIWSSRACSALITFTPLDKKLSNGAGKFRCSLLASFSTLIFFSVSNSHSSQYQFLFHHYNDISSYTQNFFLPSYKEKKFSFGVAASQDASKNITLGRSEDSSIIRFNIGMRPWRSLKFNITEKISNNHIETKSIESKVAKNELLFETIYMPKNWLEVAPYLKLLSDSYKGKSQDSLNIDNSGKERGIKGTLNIKNIGSIGSEIAFREQSISNEKRGIVDVSFEKDFSMVGVGGNFEGVNILTQYPILHGREEKFLESSKGNIFSEFLVLERLIASITYNGSFKNEIYTLLEGYGGKHNNEKRTLHNFASDISYKLNSRILFDVNIERYNGKKVYQDGLNDELSTIKTFSPSITFRPNKNSEIKMKRILRLSSFTFPNPLTVTDRDILDKSVLLTTKYNLPAGTDVALSVGRTENHIIYIRSEMSANNVRRTKYNIDTNINYFLPHRIKIEESFSLFSTYQIYDFSAQRNLFTRSFVHKSKLNILNLSLVQPSIEYNFIKQDWGSYLFSYEIDGFLFYRNIENRKESYKIDVKIEPLISFSLTPSYTFKRNRFKNLSEATEQLSSILIEEYYRLSIAYEKMEGKLLELHLTWIRRDTGNNFYEIKSKIVYGI
ncbi:MAG: hypothetical protein E3J87_09700 [Candidatus Cloacimonadota bacterium]|nr:MAG: hypothetical protein E3J87_09700 [Candidatus Cloacimonadota bacterium]